MRDERPVAPDPPGHLDEPARTRRRHDLRAPSLRDGEGAAEAGREQQRGGAGTLVLTGLATSGVVISTLRDATERQYAQIVLSDGCDDIDEEMHRFLVERFFPREADIMTCAQWTAGLAAQ
ncbi:isochorismatase family protein [Actinomadura sp. LD22]|uniref:Isochorismatase family protein n=1 Tax=Actinomadura physcomitrii TaxID=2650748 RepID=A0A6I4M4T5_9ACTN|nr:isochorismatase family protein [Actinomadura physcomitrii]MVZ99294.1 isochorismatase family protein [Actinomadura physcomitrii]